MGQIETKSSVRVRVSDVDLADIKHNVQGRYKFDTSDFIRLAIKNELANESYTLETSVKRIAMECLQNDLDNITSFGQFRTGIDTNMTHLLTICGVFSAKSSKTARKDFKNDVISDTKKALINTYSIYPEYYFELKSYITSIVKQSIYKELFAI